MSEAGLHRFAEAFEQTLLGLGVRIEEREPWECGWSWSLAHGPHKCRIYVDEGLLFGPTPPERLGEMTARHVHGDLRRAYATLR